MSTTSVAVFEQEWTSLERQERELEARVNRLRQWYNNWQDQSIASSLSRQKATKEALAKHVQWLLSIARGVYEHRLEGIRLYDKDSGNATQMEDKAYLVVCTIMGLVGVQKIDLAQAGDPELRQAVMDALFCPHSKVEELFGHVGQQVAEIEQDSQKLARDRREFKKDLRRYLQQDEASLRQLRERIMKWASQDQEHATYFEKVCPARAQTAWEMLRRREVHAGIRSLVTSLPEPKVSKKKRSDRGKQAPQTIPQAGTLPREWDIFVDVDKDKLGRKTIALLEVTNPLALMHNLLRSQSLECVRPEQVMQMLKNLCALSPDKRAAFPATEIPGFDGWREYSTGVKSFRLLIKVKEARHRRDRPAATIFLYRQW